MKDRLKAVPFYISWTLIYLFIIGATAAVAYGFYEHYSEHRIPAGSITLSVDKTQYQLGDVITFTLSNHSSAPIYITNNCPSEPLYVYRYVNNQWVELHANAVNTASCYRESRSVEIKSGAAKSQTFNDWPTLFDSPGVYRIAAAIDHSDDVPYTDFVIMQHPAVKVIQDAPASSPAASSPTSIPANLPPLPRHEREFEGFDD